MECASCEEPISQDRDYTDLANGRPLCSHCYHDTHFTCCLCGDEEHENHQHKFLVVFDPETSVLSGKLPAAIYRIVRLPYYADGMTDACLFAHALEFAAALPVDAESKFACGHLCRACQQAHGSLAALGAFKPDQHCENSHHA